MRKSRERAFCEIMYKQMRHLLCTITTRYAVIVLAEGEIVELATDRTIIPFCDCFTCGGNT